MKGRTALLALLPLGSGAASAQQAVAFREVNVVDVAAGTIRSGVTVLVRDGRIAAVGAPGAAALGGARVIDARGKYLIPGLWDIHVHATWPGVDQQFLPLLLANGVTGVREMFGRLDWVDSSRRAIAAGRFPGPRIVASGHIMDGTPPIWPGSAAVATAEAATAAVDSLIRAGADFIKVYSRLSREAFFAAARQARARGVPFAGHVPSLVRVSEAADSGIRSIEHLTGLLGACSMIEDRLLGDLAAAVASPRGWDSAGMVSRGGGAELLERFSAERCRAAAGVLVRNGTWIVPTIVVLRSTAFLDDSTLAADPRLAYIPQNFRQGWNPRSDFRFRMLTPADWAMRKRIFARQLEIVSLLHQAGVRILAGTDLANPYIYPGFSLHDELAHLVEAGMTPAQALRAATLDPARYVGAADSLGTIAEGKLADLVLLDANPLENIRHTTRIQAVMARGRLFDRAALDGILTRRRLP